MQLMCEVASCILICVAYFPFENILQSNKRKFSVLGFIKSKTSKGSSVLNDRSWRLVNRRLVIS